MPTGPRRSEERGSVLVEFVILVPLIIALIFGMIEFGLAFRDDLSLTSATRSGARVASAEVRLAGTSGHQFADDSAAAVASAVKSINSNGPQELWVYLAGNDGTPYGTGSFSTDCTTCYIYTWQSSSSTWVLSSRGSGWPARGAGSEYACASGTNSTGGTGPDSLGIYIKASHSFLTGLFGKALGLSDHTVIRLEPVPPNQGCTG